MLEASDHSHSNERDCADYPKYVIILVVRSHLILSLICHGKGSGEISRVTCFTYCTILIKCMENNNSSVEKRMSTSHQVFHNIIIHVCINVKIHKNYY